MSKTITKFEIAYFGIVFGIGFLLGFIRVLWLVALVGERTAELLEIPVMIVVFTLVAHLLVSRRRNQLTPRAVLASGLLALAILVTAELTPVVSLRGLTITEYFETRDLVVGTVYAASLVLFALMPVMSFWSASGLVDTSELRSEHRRKCHEQSTIQSQVSAACNVIRNAPVCANNS